MLGAESSVLAVPLGGAAAVRPIEPQPEQRVVESSAKAMLHRQNTSTIQAQSVSTVEQLVSSARQFADVLDRTGNVQVASSVSGFRVGHLDLYA